MFCYRARVFDCGLSTTEYLTVEYHPAKYWLQSINLWSINLRVSSYEVSASEYQPAEYRPWTIILWSISLRVTTYRVLASEYHPVEYRPRSIILWSIILWSINLLNIGLWSIDPHSEFGFQPPKHIHRIVELKTESKLDTIWVDTLKNKRRTWKLKYELIYISGS